MKYALLITITIVLSCTENKNRGKETFVKPTRDSSHLVNRPKNSFETLAKIDSSTLIYDENARLLSFSYQAPSGEKVVIPIGNLHNSFGQPPHETKIIPSHADKDKIFALVITNNIQLGISSDNVHLFALNRRTQTIYEACIFERVAEYSDKTGIDTMSDIKQYDYEIINASREGSNKLILYEYSPYKFEEENRNKNWRYTTKRKECTF